MKESPGTHLDQTRSFPSGGVSYSHFPVQGSPLKQVMKLGNKGRFQGNRKWKNILKHRQNEAESEEKGAGERFITTTPKLFLAARSWQKPGSWKRKKHKDD